MYPVLVRN